jgi:hypothetical protein
VKVVVRIDRTHNPYGEAHGVSGLRENLTSRSDGEGLETGSRDSLRHRQEAKAAGQQLIPAPYRHRASPSPDRSRLKSSRGACIWGKCRLRVMPIGWLGQWRCRFVPTSCWSVSMDEMRNRGNPGACFDSSSVSRLISCDMRLIELSENGSANSNSMRLLHNASIIHPSLLS